MGNDRNWRARDTPRNHEEKTAHNGPFIRSRDTRAPVCAIARLSARGPSIKPSDLASARTSGRTGEHAKGRDHSTTNFQDKGVNNGRATDGWYSASVETTPSNHSPITIPGAAGL